MLITKDTVVAITGASRGIGRAAAIEFAKRGARVVLLSRDVDRMNEVAKRVKEAGSDSLVEECDVSVEEQCQRWLPKAMERFGHVDILVNNAGFGNYAPIERLSTAALREIFDTNLYGSIWCAQAVIPHMRERKKGHIVNVSTIISKRSLPFMTAYCMTKFAMNAFDEGLRLELRSSGIGVSLVCPGLTKTDFQVNAKSSADRPYFQNRNGMSAERVGKAVLKAVERNRRRVNLTLGGKFLLLVNRISPWMVDELVYATLARRAQKSR